MNMKLLLFLLCLTSFTYCLSQSVTVVDSSTKKPIPYVTVKIGDNKGLYSNEEGKFIVSTSSFTFLHLNHMGYNDLSVELKKVKDTVFMKPRVIVLNEIVVKKSNKSPLILQPEKKARSYGNFPLMAQNELITLIIPDKKIVNSLIKEITFYFSNNNEKIDELGEYNKIDAIARINIYKKAGDSVAEKIYSSLPLKMSSFLKDEISLNLSEHHVALTEEGLCFGIEMLGYSDGTVIIDSKRSYIRPSLTERQNKMFYSKTYLKYVFDDATNLISISDVFKKGTPNREIERNLVFGLKLIPE